MSVTVRRLLPIGVLVALLLLVVAIVLSATPVASVRTVTVTGADPALNRKAQSALDDAVGTPIVRVDTGELRQEIIALSPSVKDADVRRVLPGTVEVTLVGRDPVLMWTDRAASTTWLVDAEGVVFGKDTKAPAGTPMLVVADQLSGDERSTAVAGAATVLTQIPPALRAKVKGMRVESRDDIRFTLKGDREVRWGSAEDSALKVAVMTRLLKAVPAKVYDVSAPELPTTRSTP